jgi:sensor histidine kinase YesM
VQNYRLSKHVLFWVIYLALNLFNELYLSASFSAHPTGELFLDALLAQVILLGVKIPAVYYTIYSLIPRWLNSPGKARLLAECIAMLFFFLIAYRLLIHQVIWKIIYNETSPAMSTLQFAARFFYSMMDLLQVTALAAAIRLFALRIAAKENEKRLESEKLRGELSHLKSQINPHFLFNTLNGIYSMSRTGSEKTPEAVMQLSKILRYVIYDSEKPAAKIADEIKMLEDYVALQKLRTDKCRISFKSAIDDPEAKIAPLLLLPLAENAFKHGSIQMVNSFIDINILLKEGRLGMVVANSYVQNDKAQKDEGIGLANIRRRLELMYRVFDLNFSKNENVFTVEMSINLKSHATV